MSKTSGQVHSPRGRSAFTLCGRRVVGLMPRHQEVVRDKVSTDQAKVTCKSCRALLGLEAPIHEKGTLR
jgi:hypothetical protein